MPESVRIDKWTWSVRLFKTRSKATAACVSGKVLINGQKVKASHKVVKGDLIQIHYKQFNKTVKVIDILSKRVGAQLVNNYCEDLTPQNEYDKLKMIHETNMEYRPRGLGRPTKKQRRNIDRLKDF